MTVRKRKKTGSSAPVVESTAQDAVDGAELPPEDLPSADPVEPADEAPAEGPAQGTETKSRRRSKAQAAEEDAEVQGDALVSGAAAEGAAAADESDDDAEFGGDVRIVTPSTKPQLKRALESLIFVSDQILSVQQLGRSLGTKAQDVREALDELIEEYQGRGIELVEISGGYQFRSAPACAQYVRDLVAKKPARLTRAQVETLALIAYRQPITRPEIDDVRGVDSGSALKVLTERDLIKVLGRKEEVGRPLLYGTTPFFLEFFGLSSMRDLPTLREFTELTAEHRELFKRKTGEAFTDELLAAQEAELGPIDGPDPEEAEAREEVIDEEEMAIADSDLMGDLTSSGGVDGADSDSPDLS
jgi:segregation and condensation protein B